MIHRTRTIVLSCLLTHVCVTANAQEFPKVYNSQETKTGPTSPQQAVAGMRLPAGFRATLFAAEPDVRQPIALAHDSKGRLWVAENYTYAEVKVRFDDQLRDRIVIFEDADSDGKFDRRTVFWDQAKHLTSVEFGFGGVWALCPPQLLFLPDANGDDRPDGQPIVVLDGFADTTNHHTLANGLRWGPDGWLYGRQGIQATSQVGRPGTPSQERVAVNGSIWRYHPTKKIFEVVCEGTTNPWGLDWDQYGQGYFINTVIGHLWHILPGAHYQRMYGQDPNQTSLYAVIQQTADHFHWDTRDSWVVTRTAGVTDGTDLAGGGHAHTGLLIYQGDNWPEAYHNDVYMLNFHGRRINRDHLERSGATYRATHRPDLLAWSDPWFRGIDLITGPDGGVMVADWSDTGECHDNDGVHRTSGRLYKITHGTPPRPSFRDIASLSNQELVALQSHRNNWFARQAQRVLQERHASGMKLAEVRESLLKLYTDSHEVPLRLRALWCLNAIDATGQDWLIDQLNDQNEHIRTWAVRLLLDTKLPADTVVQALNQRARLEKSGLVIAYLASGLQRLRLEQRWQLAAAIVQHQELASDPVVPLMVWYGLEPAFASDPTRAVELLKSPLFGPVQRFLSRRIAQERDKGEIAQVLTSALEQSKDDDHRREILLGMAEAYQADRSAQPPRGWIEAIAKIRSTSNDRQVASTTRELSILFGDQTATEQIKKDATNARTPIQDREQAIRNLVRFRPSGTAELLRGLLADREIAAQAIRGLAGFGDPSIADTVLTRYPELPANARGEALALLASRPASAEILLKAIEAGKVDRKDVPAYVVSQIRGYGNGTIPALVARLWPISDKARPRIEALRTLLNDGRLPKASLERGRSVFQKTCAQCHKLFGEGGSVGPELTGAQRGDLGYLLENILDPSSTLASDYRMTIFSLTDGRTLNGLVAERNAATVTIQTPTERVVVKASEIDEERKSNLSLMPEGILDPLSEQQVADLFRYLQSSKAAP